MAINSNEDIHTMRELIPLVSQHRIDFYNGWFEMACVIYCIGNGCQEALDIFCELSSKTTRENYDKTSCIHLWQKLYNSHKYTLGTLHYYAKLDNPEKYEDWKKKKQSEYIKLNANIE